MEGLISHRVCFDKQNDACQFYLKNKAFILIAVVSYR